MKNTLLLFIATFTVITSLLICFQIISLIRSDGFSTLLIRQDKNTFVTDSVNHKKLIGVIHAIDDNLGIIAVPLIVVQPGFMQFRIKQQDDPNWIYQGDFDTKALQALPLYPFGFPLVHNSLGKSFIVEIIPSKNSIGSVKINSQINPISKYIEPKQQYVKLILNKIQFACEELGIFTFLIIGFISFIGIILFKQLARISNTDSFFITLKKIGKYILPVICFILFLKVIFLSTSLSIDTFLFLCSIWIITTIVYNYQHQIAFIIAGVLTVSIPFFMSLNHMIIAEKVTVWVWAFLLMGIIQNIFQMLLKSRINSTLMKYSLMYELKTKRWIRQIGIKKIILFGVIVSLILAAFNKSYYLGGDDSRLYYIYPLEILKNYASLIGPDTSVSSLTSWLPSISLAPFLILMIILKTITGDINLQMVMYVANFIGGIYFFYLFVSYIIPEKNTVIKIAVCIGSLFYGLSIFNFYTLFNSQLLYQFMLSSFPLSMYLYIRGVYERKLSFFLGIGLIWTVFCYTTFAIPWLFATLLCVSPFFIVIFWKQKKRFILYTIIFALLLILLNLFWISALPYSTVVNSGNGPVTTTSVVSNNFRQQNEEGIKALAASNTVFYPLLNLYHYDIQKNYNWPYLPIFNNWYKAIVPINSILFVIILIPFYFYHTVKIHKKLYITGLVSFLLSTYFFTVNIGDWGINLFTWLSDYVPGFVMFRNMYDKFGFAMALSFAFVLTISLSDILLHTRGYIQKRIIIVILIIVLLINAKPFLFNEFNKLPIWTTKDAYSSTTRFNQDYFDLINYIKQNPNPSRYLWVPLNYGDLSQIQDNTLSNHYYTGVSPLLFLSGKNDYSGIISFETYGTEIQDDIVHRRYNELGILYRKFNVRYIIVNHTISPDLRQSYLCGDGLCDDQDSDYQKVLLGKKIKDFGSRYSLYEINSSFMNDKIYISANINSFAATTGSIQYKKISNQRYNVVLSHIHPGSILVLLDPYFKNWGVYDKEGKVALSVGYHYRPFDYANGWKLDTAAIKNILPTASYKQYPDGSMDLHLQLIFKQDSQYPFALFISLTTFVTSLLYVLYCAIKKIHNAKVFQYQKT